MIRASTLFFRASLLVCTGTAMAQETITLDTIPYEIAPLEAQPFVPQIAPAQIQPYVAPPQGASAGPTLRSKHGAWEVRCLGPQSCVMTQLHRRTAQTADAVFTIVKPEGLRNPDGTPIAAFAEIVVPLGVYLPGGLGLKVDAGQPSAAPFERCIDEGCVVRAPISDGMLQQMRQGATAMLVIFGAPDKPVQIPISLNGFTAAFNAF